MKPFHVRLQGAVLIMLSASSAHSWGGYGHRLVNFSAVGNLPTQMVRDGSGLAFGDMRAYLAEHAVDPDIRKNLDPREHARHWCDIDAHPLRYPPPFDTVPREYERYLSAFGRANGVVQWEGIRDNYRALAALMRVRCWPLAWQCAAELGHYVGDAGSPLHCTRNHDGERSANSRNIGIHSRYENAMVRGYISRLDTAPGSAVRVEDPLELGFALVTTGNSLVAGIMEADLKAQEEAGDIESRRRYFGGLFRLAGKDARDRLSLSARRLADLWYSAWREAGSPPFDPSAPWFDCPALWLLGAGAPRGR